jgi:NhaA family Na+:H+ antiporter
MHDSLYEHQRALEVNDLVGYAVALGLDGDEFRREVEAHAHADRVEEDVRGALRSGANGTPTFFINGLRHNGSHREAELLRALRSSAPHGRRQ